MLEVSHVQDLLLQFQDRCHSHVQVFNPSCSVEAAAELGEAVEAEVVEVKPLSPLKVKRCDSSSVR